MGRRWSSWTKSSLWCSSSGSKRATEHSETDPTGRKWVENRENSAGFVEQYSRSDQWSDNAHSSDVLFVTHSPWSTLSQTRHTKADCIRSVPPTHRECIELRARTSSVRSLWTPPRLHTSQGSQRRGCERTARGQSSRSVPTRRPHRSVWWMWFCRSSWDREPVDAEWRRWGGDRWRPLNRRLRAGLVLRKEGDATPVLLECDHLLEREEGNVRFLSWIWVETRAV